MRSAANVAANRKQFRHGRLPTTKSLFSEHPMQPLQNLPIPRRDVQPACRHAFKSLVRRVPMRERLRDAALPIPRVGDLQMRDRQVALLLGASRVGLGELAADPQTVLEGAPHSCRSSRAEPTLGALVEARLRPVATGTNRRKRGEQSVNSERFSMRKRNMPCINMLNAHEGLLIPTGVNNLG